MILAISDLRDALLLREALAFQLPLNIGENFALSHLTPNVLCICVL